MSSTAAQEALLIGEWLADPSDDTLTRDGKTVRIEPRTMRLLMCLAQSPGKVLTQDQLLDQVWSGVVVSPASLYQSISQLRKVLGDTETPPKYIETVARKGYRFIAPVRPSPTDTFEHAPASERSNVLISTPVSESAATPSARSVSNTRWVWAGSIAGALLVALLAGLSTFHFGAREDVTPRSLAVLPFVDLTPERSEQSFSDGLTEELSTWLAQLPSLRVVARSSAFSFKDKSSDARKIGESLGVTHLIEGSLRRNGDKLRVTVKLIDAREGFQVWSSSYDTSLADMISVQEQIARAVANNLELRLTPAIDDRLAARHGTNPKAYAAYLLAAPHIAQLTREDNRRAVELYQSAVDADPRFALARVRLANALLDQRFFDGRPLADLAPEAEAQLDAAARLIPNLPELYLVRGRLALDQKQPRAALEHFQRAIQLDPNSLEAASQLGYYHLIEAEPILALKYFAQALSLSPLDANLHAMRCIALTDMATFVEAEAECQRARELSGRGGWGYVASAELEHARGNYTEAFLYGDQALARSPGAVHMHLERAEWLLELGAMSEAQAEHNAAIQAGGDPASDPGLARVGLLTSQGLGGPGAVRAYLTEHALSRSVDPKVRLQTALALARLGEFDPCKSLLETAMRSLKTEQMSDPWLARQGTSDLLTISALLQMVGDPAAAEARLQELEQLIDRLLASGIARHQLYELKAQAAALRGNQDAAMQALTRAANAGWRAAWSAQNEQYFTGMRKRADFRELLTRVNALNEKDRVKLHSRFKISP